MRGWKLLINLTVSVSGSTLPKVRAENHPKCNRWFSIPNPAESCSIVTTTIIIIRNFNHQNHQSTICWAVSGNRLSYNCNFLTFWLFLTSSLYNPGCFALHLCKHSYFDVRVKVAKHLLMAAQPYYPQHRHISYLHSLPTPAYPP